jgi:hypothetical protein
MQIVEIPDVNNKVHAVNTAKIIMFYPRLSGRTVVELENGRHLITIVPYEELLRMIKTPE